MALMNKSVDLARRGMPLEILSATATDNVDNFVFVEAYRKNSVQEAIANLNFFLGKIEMLPLNEMTRLYESHKSKSLPAPISWVRIKSGVYDGDIGVCTRILSDDKVEVKLIPRVDPNRTKDKTKTKGGAPDRKRPRQGRIPQRAFDPTKFKDVSHSRPQHSSQYFFSWGGLLFRKGFLYKQFNLKQLEWSSQGQQATIGPTLDERKRFLEVYDRFRSKLHPEADGDSSDDEESDKFVKLLV